MILRRLTESGIARFVEFLDSLSGDRPIDYPEELLDDEEDAQIVDARVEVEKVQFINRLAAAKYLDERFANLRGVEYDKGVWAWLALFYFKEICKVGSDGQYRPGEVARWI